MPVSFAGVHAFGNDTHDAPHRAGNRYKELARRKDRPVEHVVSATGHHVIRTDGDCWGDVMGDKVVAQTEPARQVVQKKFRVLVDKIRDALEN